MNVGDPRMGPPVRPEMPKSSQERLQNNGVNRSLLALGQIPSPASVHRYERLTPAMALATLLSVWQSVVSPMISMDYRYAGELSGGAGAFWGPPTGMVPFLDASAPSASKGEG